MWQRRRQEGISQEAMAVQLEERGHIKRVVSDLELVGYTGKHCTEKRKGAVKGDLREISSLTIIR